MRAYCLRCVVVARALRLAPRLAAQVAPLLQEPWFKDAVKGMFVKVSPGVPADADYTRHILEFRPRNNTGYPTPALDWNGNARHTVRSRGGLCDGPVREPPACSCDCPWRNNNKHKTLLSPGVGGAAQKLPDHVIPPVRDHGRGGGLEALQRQPQVRVRV